jgi:hypothetical protein
MFPPSKNTASSGQKLGSFARTQTARAEYPRVDSPTRMGQAISRLRSDGFPVSAYKLQRWRCFGIATFRRGRGYFFEPNVLRNLRYILDIERLFGFEHDHNGLALELAYRRYPTIPWERVHESARKKLKTMFNGLNRELHKIDGSDGSTFALRRIPHAARSLVRRYITNKQVRERPSLADGRDALEKIVALWLRVSYNNESITEAKLLPILYGMRVRDPNAVPLATILAKTANQVIPLLQVVHRGPLSDLLDREFDTDDIRYTVASMRVIYSLAAPMWEAGVSAFQSYAIDYPAIENAAADPRTDVTLRGLMYAGAVFITGSPMGKAMIDHQLAGNSFDVSPAIRSFVAMKDAALPRIFGEREDG